MCEDVENDSNQSNIYVRRDELADTKSSTNKKNIRILFNRITTNLISIVCTECE